MRKVFSWIFFVLAVVLVLATVVYAVYAVFEMNAELEDLSNRGASGHEYFGVGIGLLLLIPMIIIDLTFSSLSALIAREGKLKICASILAYVCLFVLFVGVYLLIFL